MNVTLEQARAAKPRCIEIFARFGEIVGVGIGQDGDSHTLEVRLSVRPRVRGEFPLHVNDVPVRVRIVSMCKARGVDHSHGEEGGES